jgi:hypothetical protein
VAVKTPLVGEQAKAFGAAMKDRIRALDAAKGASSRPGTPRPAAQPNRAQPPPAARTGGDPRPVPPPDDFNVPF